MAGRLHVDDWTRYRELPRYTQAAPPTLTPNLAPRRWLSMLRREDRDIVLRDAFWGLTPSWLQILDHAPHCARAESLEERPMFREALVGRRCVVPVTGVFIWQLGLRGKQPYLITSTDRAPLLLAGLWSRFSLDAGKPRDSCALVTVPSSEFIAPLTDRLPAIIAPERLEAWLDPSSGLDQVHALLKPAPRELLGAFPVSKRVNDPAQQDWACAYPVGPMHVWTP